MMDTSNSKNHRDFHPNYYKFFPSDKRSREPMYPKVEGQNRFIVGGTDEWDEEVYTTFIEAAKRWHELNRVWSQQLMDCIRKEMEWNLATDGMGDVFVRRDMKRLSKTSNDLLGHHNKWMTSDELMLEKMDVDQGESSQSH